MREGEGWRCVRLFMLILVMVLAIALAKAAQQGVFLAAAGRSRIADAFILSAFALAGTSFLVSAVA
ncbi:MAG TPA: hypothetical protein VL172_17500, partial [Kofleriaceae bacterium]|nr:hypothetical protein [Kofleriaceae bacterium]